MGEFHFQSYMAKNYQREGGCKGYGGDDMSLEGVNGNPCASTNFSLGVVGIGKVGLNLGWSQARW